jgi:hypothetical protein
MKGPRIFLPLGEMGFTKKQIKSPTVFCCRLIRNEHPPSAVPGQCGSPPLLSLTLFSLCVARRAYLFLPDGKKGCMEKGPQEDDCEKSWASSYTVKKLSDIPVPSRHVTTKLSLAGNNDVIYKLFLPRESLVSDIAAGDGKLDNLFLRCMQKFPFDKSG